LAHPPHPQAEAELAGYFFLFPQVMKTGTVKFFNETKGFGFITDDTTREEFFVHVTGLNGGQIQQNDRVEFETQEGRKGVNAVNVRRI
jgi:CspA family cold shock protein